jgi:hypothetical protein
MLSPTSLSIVRQTLPAVGAAIPEITTTFYGSWSPITHLAVRPVQPRQPGHLGNLGLPADLQAYVLAQRRSSSRSGSNSWTGACPQLRSGTSSSVLRLPADLSG